MHPAFRPPNPSPLGREVSFTEMPKVPIKPSAGPSGRRESAVALGRLSLLRSAQFNTGAKITLFSSPVAEEMARLIPNDNTKQVCAMYMRFFRPGDWGGEEMKTFLELMQDFVENDNHPERGAVFQSRIELEMNIASLADELVGLFGLSAPNEQICILWDPSANASEDSTTMDLAVRRERMRVNIQLLDDFHIPCPLGYYHRPPEYLVEAIINSHQCLQRKLKIVKRIGQFVTQVKTFRLNNKHGDDISHLAREWLKTEIGQKIHIILRIKCGEPPQSVLANR